MKRSPNTPRDVKGNAVQLSIATPAISITNSAAISTSTVIAINAGTSLIEVNAKAQDIFLKYGTSAGVAVTSSDFDEVVLADQVRHYIIPVGITHIAVIESAPTARIILIQK